MRGCDISASTACDTAVFERLAGDFGAFLVEPNVSSGLWCDPKVMRARGMPLDGKQTVLLKMSWPGEGLACLPFEVAADRVRLGIGLWRPFAVSLRSARLCDFEFPIRGAENRTQALASACMELRRTGDVDLVIAQNCALLESKVPKGALIRHRQSTFLIRMPASYEKYVSMLSSNTRQVLRRKTRNLARKTGEQVTVRCFRKEEEMSELHGRLSRVWQGSWHGRMGGQAPPSVDFLKTLAREGWVRAYVLFVGQDAVASVLGFQYRGKFLDEAPAFDEQWRDYSPGVVLNNLILQDLFESDTPEVVDFGFGYNQYKEMLGTECEERAELWVAASAKGRAVLATARVCDFVYSVGKRLPGGSSLVRRLKSRVQRRR